MSQELKFKIGEETLPITLSNKEAKDSPFADPISHGLRNLTAAVNSADAGFGKKHNEYPNNIISFLGERGSGKTSCLYSVWNHLKTTTGPDGELLFNKVLSLPVIDPSFFDEDHNILDIFIGELYHNYQTECEKYNSLNTDQRTKLKKLQAKFKEAKQAIYFLDNRNQEKPIDELEELGRLSDGVELQRILYNLISEYLEYMGKKCLIIRIDDLDLNIRQSYRMMEQIRKYLILPNIVILFAAKLDQLRQSICRVLTEHYGNVLDTYVNQQEIIEMAERYLEKLLPTDHRVYMPAIDVFMQAKLVITDGDATEEFPSVEFAVPALIFRKTRFLFYNHDMETSLIVPRNLRELRFLVTTLYKMPKLDETKPEIHRSNKEQFKQYFKEQWLQTLTIDQQRLAKIILGETNISKLNKLVVSKLYERSKRLRGLRVMNEKSNKTAGINTITKGPRCRLEEIVQDANNPVNVSLAT